jgi:hypothetical protein
MGAFFAENWGNLASVVGLVFSILAFVFSKRASKAAEEARDSVLRKSLGQDMSDATRTATDILRFVGLERGDTLLRIGELLNHTSFCLSRWDTKLSDESMIKLRRAQEQLLSINEALTRRPIAEMTTIQRSRLAQLSQQVSIIFNEEHGTAMKATDRVN